MKDSRFFRQAELLLQIIPFFSNVKVFALKGGTAINFFIRDLPRLSVKQREPQWGLLGIEHIHELPAVKWKLINLEQMNRSKHQKAVKRLRKHLEL